MTRTTNPLLKLTAALLLGLSSLAWAATLTVTTTKDELFDFGNSINDCSLREAIISINEGRNMFGCSAAGAFGSNDKIILPAGTYELIQTFDTPQNQNEGNLNIRRAMTIDGAGAASTIIDGFGVGGRNSCGGVINVDDGTIEKSFAAVIRGVTIRKGRIGDDICRSSAIIAETERGGGGIYNAESLTLESVVVQGNDATAGPGSGGGILNLGKLTVRDSQVLGNEATFAGGIANSGGELLVERSTITGNVTTNNGGGLSNSGRGRATLRDTTVGGNRAGNVGGGVSNLFDQASLTILNSTISGNVSADEGGGIMQGDGNATLTVMNGTISGNSAGASGAGIFANDGLTRLSSVTIRDNTVTGATSSGVGGGVRPAGAAVVRVENSIIAGNRDQSTGTVHNDCSGSFESFGFNLIGDASGCSGFTRVSDQKGTRASPLDPRLGPLASNGGPTRTHRLLAGSPAIDAGGIAQPPPELRQDQRSVSRPLDGDGDGSARFDIGAYELEPLADLSVALEDSPDPVQENGIVTYTLQVRNDGPTSAPDAVASAAVSGGTVINSGSCRLQGSQGVTCLLGDVAFGQVVSRSFTVLASAGSQTVTATAEVVSNLPDPDLSDNGASETTTVKPAVAALDMDLRDSADPVLAGALYDYTVTVKNTGDSRLGQVAIGGTLSGGAILESLPSGCSAQSATVFGCTINGLDSGESNQRTVTVRAPASPGTARLEATVDSDLTNPISDAETTTVRVAEADLAITKVGPAVVQVNQQFGYTIAVENLDQEDASGQLLVQDVLPAGVTFVAASSDAFACAASGQQVSCSAGFLEPGQVFTATLTVRAPSAPGTVTNVATVASGTPDPNGANDASDPVVTTVTQAPPPPAADLTLIKSAPASVEVGEAFRYELTVINTSAQTAQGVTVTDTLPAEVGFLSASGGCALSGRTVTCTLGSLAGGEVATRFIEVAAPAAATTLVNSASVAGSTDDPNPANDRDAAETVVTPPDGVALQPGIDVRLGQNTPANATVAAGSAGNPVLQIALSAAADEDVTLGEFSLRAAGNGQDALDLTAVKLVADLDGDGRIGAGDTLLAAGRFAADDGTLTLAPTSEVTVPAGGTLHVLVAVDLNSALARGPFVPLLGLGMLGFGLRSLARRRRLWLLLALAGVLLVTSCGVQAPTPPVVQFSSYQLTLTSVSADGKVSGTVADVAGLPLSGARLDVRK